jgi:hypothetical protein
MFSEIPQYGLRAYALLFSRHGSREAFGQSDLEWIVGESMRKKIFALLLRSGWIRKASRGTYICAKPDDIINGLLEFKAPEIIKSAERPYAFTGLSAVEIWSDYSYVQRGVEKSPYFIKVLGADLRHWKDFFNGRNIPVYVNSGSTIGEYVILIPVEKLCYTEKNGFKVDSLKETVKTAAANDAYKYAYEYIKNNYDATNKYGPAAA